VIGLFKKAEQRSVDASRFGLALDDFAFNKAGVEVTQDTALSLSVVYGAVRLLGNDVGSLPMDAFRVRAGERTKIEPSPIWIDEPNPWNPNETGVDHRSQVVASLVMDGNAFVYVVPNVFAPVELHVLNPQQVEVETDRRGAPSYIVRDSRSAIIDTLTPLNCLHLTLFRTKGNRGLSPIEAMQQGIGRGMAAEETGARFFGQGSLMGGLVEYPPEAGDPDPEQVKELLKGLNKRHRGIRNQWALGALTAGAKFHELTVKPSDSQLIETEEWTLEQFARTLGIPPSMLGSQKPGAVAYASIEQRAIDYGSHAVLPITVRMDKAYSRLLPRGSFVKINLRGFSRADMAARYQAYSLALNNKFMKIDEVRALEDFEPFGGEDGGFLETPNNNPPEPQGEDANASQE
jgi:HK97 family phage portal protein